VNQEPALHRCLSKVEVTGAEARHYDLIMNLITGGTYPFGSSPESVPGRDPAPHNERKDRATARGLFASGPPAQAGNSELRTPH